MHKDTRTARCLLAHASFLHACGLTQLFSQVFLVARKMGFGVLHDLLLKGGEEPSRWLRNKAWRVVTEFCGTRRRIKRCLTGTVNVKDGNNKLNNTFIQYIYII